MGASRRRRISKGAGEGPALNECVGQHCAWGACSADLAATPGFFSAHSRKSPVRAMNRATRHAMVGRRKQGETQMANDNVDLARSGKAVAFVYVTDRDRALAFY